MGEHTRGTSTGAQVNIMREQDKLSEAEKDELICAYISRYSRPFTLTADHVLEKTDENFWAYEKFDELVKCSPDIAFELIIRTLAQTENDDVLDNLAAGPLEDLVRVHGERFIGQIEVQARKDEKFRRLLGGLWTVGEPNIWARIEKLVGETPV